MVNISEAEFNGLKSKGFTFPLQKEINADELTPISIFNSLVGKNKCLLESSYGFGSSGRYSFISMDPYMVVKGQENQTLVEDGTKVKKYRTDVITVVRKILKQKYRTAGLKVPFIGGAIGYVGYDYIKNYEVLPDTNQEKIGIPETCFLFYKTVICYDHMKHTLAVIYNVQPESCEDYNCVLQKLDEQIKSIRSNSVSVPLSEKGEVQKIESNLTKEQFCELVERAKEYIRSGDIFQVVLSQRFKVTQTASAFEVYRRLRSKNPSPYLFFIDFNDFQVVGSSPESLVSLQGKRVTTNPIAGTRPRGKSDEEDLLLKEELLSDEKERAEHVMLVDLGRNDIGKVSSFGSVKLDRFMEVDYYSHVMHIVTTVSGEIKEDKDCFDALMACAPAGTVSGAPKIRAMEIIAELENMRRGLYAGAVGYFSYDGNMDVCIAIRTIIFKNGAAYIQAGAGIVYDSDPEKEYEETINKARALIEVI
ncbi:anthranilate synthase component I [Clostridium thermarum]|uniref:anthranilate synthase component I n=1 Tax=Clostridium thermarum TaxID=1716543 RepID=UPI0013D354D6|nr:anthranilate synthase component I [Clostridium thermarum]